MNAVSGSLGKARRALSPGHRMSEIPSGEGWWAFGLSICYISSSFLVRSVNISEIEKAKAPWAPITLASGGKAA